MTADNNTRESNIPTILKGIGIFTLIAAFAVFAISASGDLSLMIAIYGVTAAFFLVALGFLLFSIATPSRIRRILLLLVTAVFGLGGILIFITRDRAEILRVRNHDATNLNGIMTMLTEYEKTYGQFPATLSDHEKYIYMPPRQLRSLYSPQDPSIPDYCYQGGLSLSDPPTWPIFIYCAEDPDGKRPVLFVSGEIHWHSPDELRDIFQTYKDEFTASRGYPPEECNCPPEIFP